MANNSNKSKTRKVLSLKSTADMRPVSASYGSRTVDVEVRKKRSGLAINIAKSLRDKYSLDDNKDNGQQNGKLTDSVALSKLVNSYSKEITTTNITRYKHYYSFLQPCINNMYISLLQ